MDLPRPKYLESSSYFPSHGEALMEGKNGFLKPRKENPFVESISDPLCKLNLKETSEFVKALPMGSNVNENRGLLDVSVQKRRDGSSSVTKRNMVEAPSTPGRPIFSFSTAGNPSRKNFPSKWDDAEKWLITGNSCQDSPGHYTQHHGLIKSKHGQSNGFVKPFSQQDEIFAEKSRVITEEKFSKAISVFQGPIMSLVHHNSARGLNGVSAPTDLPLKDKFTNEVESNFPKFRCLEPMKEGFLFGNPLDKCMKNAAIESVLEIKSRDIGTEMTPLGSSTTSRCPTPFKTLSPPRHNTPANRSGPLALTNSNNSIDIAEFQECHLAKMQLESKFDSVASNWSSREEEEEDISKSLRHFEMSNECRRSVSESKACAWEEEEKTKCCLRYQREEAKIQAWVNLQNAKAEAQSKKLEVKIQKMRSNLEEKLMKRMAIVHRKAEELRAVAQQQHAEQVEKASDQAKKTVNRYQSSHLPNHGSCGCFPCNNHCH